jgi:hypothetical protein
MNNTNKFLPTKCFGHFVINNIKKTLAKMIALINQTLDEYLRTLEQKYMLEGASDA